MSAAGLYALLHESVSAERRNIGIRLALGAGAGQIVGRVVGRALILVVVGMGRVAVVAGGEIAEAPREVDVPVELERSTGHEEDLVLDQGVVQVVRDALVEGVEVETGDRRAERRRHPLARERPHHPSVPRTSREK